MQSICPQNPQTMTPWHSSRASTRPPSSRRARNARTSRLSVSKKVPARPPVSVYAESVSSHHGDRYQRAGSSISVESHADIVPEQGDHESLGRFNDSLDHVVLAIDKTRRNTIGASYYVAGEGVLHIMEDIDCAENDTVNLCKLGSLHNHKAL